MPFALDNPKDVWGRIEALRKTFSARDALLADCEKYLAIADLQYQGNNKELTVKIEDAKGYIQVQAHWATVRIHVPFQVKIPVPLDMAAADRVRVDNAELLGQGLLQEAFNRRSGAGQHPGSFSLASYIVHRGAAAGYHYWKEHPRDGYRPCAEFFDPKYVYFESDEWGPCFYAVRSTLPEGDLARYLDAKQSTGVGSFLHSYDPNSRVDRDIYRVWARDGQEIYYGMVGAAPQGGTTQNLLSMRRDDDYDEMPVFYIPAGGRASLTTGFSQGMPFYADMRADVDVMNRLRVEEFVTIMNLATAPGLTRSADGTATLNLLPGAENKVTPDVEHQVLQVSSPGALPALQGELERSRSMIEQKGLSYQALGYAPAVRSEALRRGMELAALQTIQPYVQTYQEAHRMLATMAIQQARVRLEKGQAKTITDKDGKPKHVISVNGPNKKIGADEPKRTAYKFGLDDVYWDGMVEIVLSPLETAERSAQMLQTAQTKMQFFSDFIPPSRILEEDLGYEQPAKLALQAREEKLAAQFAPGIDLVDWSIIAGQLTKIQERFRLKGELDAADAEYVANVIGRSKLQGLQGKDVVAETLLILMEYANQRRRIMREQLLPEAQAKARQEQKGGAPAPKATVSPDIVASQGSLGTNGHEGTGGPGDEMAAMNKAASGSDQMPGGA